MNKNAKFFKCRIVNRDMLVCFWFSSPRVSVKVPSFSTITFWLFWLRNSEFLHCDKGSSKSEKFDGCPRNVWRWNQ